MYGAGYYHQSEVTVAHMLWLYAIYYNVSMGRRVSTNKRLPLALQSGEYPLRGGQLRGPMWHIAKE